MYSNPLQSTCIDLCVLGEHDVHADDSNPLQSTCIDLCVLGELDEHADDSNPLQSTCIALCVARSCSADHTEAVPLQHYSGCTARQGQGNRMLHKALQHYASGRVTRVLIAALICEFFRRLQSVSDDDYVDT